jgi:hypothetical protein
MMIDVTGSEKTALNTYVESAIADRRRPLLPRARSPEAIVAKFEPPPAVTAALLLAEQRRQHGSSMLPFSTGWRPYKGQRLPEHDFRG